MRKLGIKDKKILYELDLNSREKISNIARRVGLSKQAVAKRIQKMENERTIRRYLTAINFESLGLSIYSIYLKLQSATTEDEKRIVKLIKSNPHVYWMITTHGEFDLIFSVLLKDISEYEGIMNDIFSPIRMFIREKLVVRITGINDFNRTYLLEKPPEKAFKRYYGYHPKEKKLDKLDKGILRELLKNARIPIIDLAEKIGTTPRVARYRLRNLEKEGIIQGYTVVLNRKKIRVKHRKIILETKWFDKEKKKKLLSFCELNKYVIAIVTCIGGWDVEIDIEAPSTKTFHDLVSKLRNLFSKEIQDFKLLAIVKEHTYCGFYQKTPFLH